MTLTPKCPGCQRALGHERGCQFATGPDALRTEAPLPPGTRITDTDDGREWSTLVDDDKIDPPLRLDVYAESGGLIRVGLVGVTSRTESAKELRRGPQQVFWLRRDELHWLAAILPKVAAYAEATRQPASPAEETERDR